MRRDRIALYEDDGSGAYIQADNGPVWALEGRIGEGRFYVDAPEWVEGNWSPDDDYMRRDWERRGGGLRGLTLVAAWTRQHKLAVVVPYPGPAAADYLGVLSAEAVREDDT